MQMNKSQNIDDFAEKVFFVVNKIPSGKVTTYGAIAQKCGMKSSARQVGYLLKIWAKQYALPYHRVINRKGILTGKNAFGTTSGVNNMVSLLEIEGIIVNDDKVDIKLYEWDMNEINNL